MCFLQDAQAQGQLINGTLKVAGGVQKAVDTDVANQVNDLGKQQAVVDHAIQSDVHSQQYVLNKTANDLGKQQAVIDHAIQNDVHNQADVLNKAVIDAGKQQAIVDHAIASDLAQQQKVLNKTVTAIGTVSSRHKSSAEKGVIDSEAFSVLGLSNIMNGLPHICAIQMWVLMAHTLQEGA